MTCERKSHIGNRATFMHLTKTKNCVKLCPPKFSRWLPFFQLLRKNLQFKMCDANWIIKFILFIQIIQISHVSCRLFFLQSARGFFSYVCFVVCGPKLAILIEVTHTHVRLPCSLSGGGGCWLLFRFSIVCLLCAWHQIVVIFLGKSQKWCIYLNHKPRQTVLTCEPNQAK